MKSILRIVAVVTLCASLALAGDITGKVKVRRARNSANVIVYIDQIKGKVFEPPKKHAVMDQKNLEFIPHVLPILVGTTVDFLNSDDVLHNVFSPDYPGGKFNLGTWAKGVVKSYTFSTPGVATILCNVHPEMEAYIVALKTPYFAKTDKKGNFTIKNVPPGEYTLKVWHEKRKAKPQTVKVPAKGTVTVKFNLK